VKRKSTRAEGPSVSGMVVRMTSGGFLSTEAVVATLACVALLAVVSALALAPLDRLARHHIAAFLGCLVAIWAVAALVIALIRRTI
jgi:hypothetical protein